MKRAFMVYITLFLTIVFSCLGPQAVLVNEVEPDPNDLSLYMDGSIYDAQSRFSDYEVTPGRGFSLLLQLGGLNEDGMVEAVMIASSDTEIVRSVQINKTDRYSILGIRCGMPLSDAFDTLSACHYTLLSSTKNADGSYTDEYSSYRDLYRLNLETDPSANVTNVFLMKNPSPSSNTTEGTSDRNDSVSSGSITDVWGNPRFELAPYVGKDYHELLADTFLVSVLRESSDEIKIGNDHVSITATADGIITRIRLDEDDTDFCVCGTYAQMGTSDLHEAIWSAGYKEKEGDEDREWRIFTNENEKRFLAYKPYYASATQIYFGMSGYMPL